MKYIKSYILFVIMGFAVAGCTIDDLKDDVNDLKDRVTLIEQQVKLLNDNLAVIGYILDPQNKTVSKVETVKENGVAAKYVITLSDNTQLTLTIGKEGTVNEPEITIGDDGKWYINGISTGVVAVGENGKNGEGYPEFRVQNGNWQIRFGDGEWDANSNGIWDREPVKESDQIGFRLKEHVLETLRGATSCEGKGWDKVTNPDAIIIDTFQVTRQDVSGFSPVLTVNMHAASKADPQTVVDASYSVTGFNLSTAKRVFLHWLSS